MYGCERNGCLATRGRSADRPMESGSAQRPHTRRSMVAGRSLHGPGLANPPQSSTGQGQRPCRPSTDVEGLRPARRGNPHHQEEPRPQERLAPVGEPPEGTGEPVHPEAGSKLVTGDVSIENVLRLLEAQQYRCALTGRSLTPQTAALDHVVPVRFGGEHVIQNAQVLHKDVNRAKGSLTSGEFIGMCREVVRWSDSTTTREETL